MAIRLISGLVLVLLISFGQGIATCTAAVQPLVEVSSLGTEITVSVDGAPVDFPDQAPYLTNNRTMVPLRFISEAMGAKVDWDEDNRKVIVEGNKVIELTLDSDQATINGTAVQLDAPPQVMGQRTMIPLRFVSEALGAEVKYVQTGNSSQIPPAWRIDVDVSEQKVRIYDADLLIKDLTASTGLNNSTPMGSFLLQNRGEWFFSSKYQEGARWWVSFKDWGTYLFHSVPMDRQGIIIDEEADKLGIPASHGCVRLAAEDAQWLYNNLPAGTPVSIHV